MRILELKPANGSGHGGAQMVARFDVEFEDSIRLYQLRLMDTENGWRIHFPAVTGGGRAASLSFELREKLIELATEGLRIANDRDQHKAA